MTYMEEERLESLYCENNEDSVLDFDRDNYYSGADAEGGHSRTLHFG